jgi:ATP-dependent Clp protease ATP-binding subunit ClpA
MQACGVELAELGEVVKQYLDQEYQSLKTQEKGDPSPTAGFQRVIQRAILHVQSSGKDTVTGANVLVALFSERDSYAVYFLQQQDMTRLDAVSYISHGIGKGGKRIEDAGRRKVCSQGRQKGFRARPVLRQSQREGAGGQDRSADRARA